MGLNLFSRRPEWLYRALGLTEPETPHQLDSPVVTPTLDVFQRGWGTARFGVLAFTIPQNTGAGTLTLLEATDDAAIILGVDALDGTAGGGDYRIDIVDTVLVRSVGYRTVTLAGGGRARTTDLLESIYPLYLPPEMLLRINHPATGAGEQINVNILHARIPPGFKPI